MEGHHTKRRVYPQQQYEFNAEPASDAGYGYSAEAAVFTPGVPAVDQVTADIAQMNVDPRVADASAQEYVPGAPYNIPPSSTPLAGSVYGRPERIPLNQLYDTDLLHELPPPVSDLDLPPPPVIVPPDSTLTGNQQANAPTEFIRSTLNVLPTTNGLLKKTKMPLALCIHPAITLKYEDENVPVVEDTVVSRCRRCRAYINPFVTFLDHQNRWECNICGLTNELPTAFDWDAISKRAMNRYDRKEVNYGVVDFIAPTEYLIRPPQPPVYVFVLDVSVNAGHKQLLATVAELLKSSLDSLPNKDGRARVAFIAVDNSLKFFRIPVPKRKDSKSQIEGGEDDEEDLEPSILVVGDLEDPFLPTPKGLLVGLSECRASIDQLLTTLPNVFANTIASGNALGSALKAAHKLIANIGGKIICITASLPNMGIAKLDVREDRKMLGTAKETSLFSAANSFYRAFAIDCNRSQVTVDMFLMSSQYQDVASLSSLPRYTGGQTYFYPGWSATRPTDVAKFTHELRAHLAQEIGFEAVLRVRASGGLRATGFYGNFFIRSSDLMAFATFPRDQSYVVELSLDENISKPFVMVQAALLLSTCHGERRIRVINLQIPTSGDIADVYASVDQQAVAAYYAHKAVERVIHNGIADAHQYLGARLMDIFKTYRQEVLKTNQGTTGALKLCANLRMLPLLINALKKHVALRKSSLIGSDLRVAAMNLLTTLPVPYLIKYIHPHLFALHTMPDNAGLVDEYGSLVLPPKMNLSGQYLESHGLYLLDDGQVVFLWVGRDAVPQLLYDTFGVQTEEEVPAGKAELPELETDFNKRVRAIIAASRAGIDSVYYPSLYIIKENSEPALRLWATTLLIEDRTDAEPSYYEFLNSYRGKLNA